MGGKMAKHKYPSELNTRHVRVSLGAYTLLKEISRRAGVTMTEALDLALERQEQVARVSPAQTRMIDVIMPGQVTASIIPSRVTGNGVAHVQPKIIKGVS
jgi:hypothetical protein